MENGTGTMRPPEGDADRLLRTVAGALLLAAVNQWLFFDKPFGATVPIFVALLYAWYFSVIGPGNRSGSPASWILLAGIALLSLTYVLFANGVFYLLNVPALWFLMAFHAVLHAGRAGRDWYRGQALANVFLHLVPGTLASLPVPFRLLKGRMEGSVGRRRLMAAGKIAAGLLVALPVVLVVTALLASADRAFGRVLAFIPDLWPDMHPAELVVRGVWFAVVFLALFGFVWSLAAGKPPGEAAAGSSGGMPAVDPLIVHTVLGAVNAVYAVFVAVQFSYLFGAWDGTLPDGTTYAEYARSGFFELSAVGAINFGLLAAALALSRPSDAGRKRMQRGLLTALLVFTLVMLVSAHVRLSLYEDAYGYTVMRFLVHAFLVYLGALTAAALWRVWRDGVNLVRLFAAISLAAWLSINYIGTDRLVAELNIARHKAGGTLDAGYLSQLSDDAVPAMLKLKDDPGIRPELERRLERLEADAERRPTVSFNLARWRALKLLEKELR